MIFGEKKRDWGIGVERAGQEASCRKADRERAARTWRLGLTDVKQDYLHDSRSGVGSHRDRAGLRREADPRQDVLDVEATWR